MKPKLLSEITTMLNQVPIVTNKWRKDFLARFVVALIQSRRVQFCEVAHHLNDQAKIASNQTRIEDFFRETALDYQQVARLLVNLLPQQTKLRLCIDRTEWDFGSYQANVLMVVAGCGQWHLPLFWELLDNRSGNSNAQQRIELLENCLALLGKERIGLVIGDREFVGHKWVKYLKDNGLLFVMRLPAHHSILRADGRQQTLADFRSKAGTALLLSDCQVDGVWGQVWLKELPNGEWLYLFGTANGGYLGQFYRKRWTIETVFQSFKERGFNLESTHLKDSAKLKKLIALVSLAYGFCRSLGLVYHGQIKAITRKKHGYLGNSFCRKGIELLRQWLRADQTDPLIDWCLRLVKYFTLRIHRTQLKTVG